MSPGSVRLGILYMLFASFSFALMGAAVKVLSQSVPSVEIVFFRNAIGTVIVLYSLYQRPVSHKGGRPWLLFFRGLMGTVALFAVFYNLAHIPLAEAVTFVQTSPIFVAVFAWLFLKEQLSPFSWVAVFIGFGGIVLITQPEGVALSKTDWLGILSGVGAALAYTSIRELKSHYDTRTIVLSFMLTGTIAPVVLMILGEVFESQLFDFLLAPFVMPEAFDWFLILVVGITATLGQIYITKAYGETKAGIVATIGYSNIVFAGIIGFVLGDMFPDSIVIAGMVLITLSGVIVAREKKRG